jgi:hypothetical protein
MFAPFGGLLGFTRFLVGLYYVLLVLLIVFCSYNDTSVCRTKGEKFHNHCMQYIMYYSFWHRAVYVYICTHITVVSLCHLAIAH